ncbi:hypothetical protein MHAS_02258 [Mycolicibacterium hassiacum DSM 44199]|jgi:preprotein translocase subunit YajC|nr:preprotein translocase subunit YajC [Mycolicibacterium hassiacum]MDA4085706.1 preprotein translocase subunit YajC [Mycolicibacterium hassiacum DSM 44199]PZN24207.1 MAG: preprotein translocase subunit YajC [Mycolicibacterium hassiacum]VCT90553.1 hypothetical protein MHAS_02258 [Mycolicibacterium hassiacum DSM 44199]
MAESTFFILPLLAAMAFLMFLSSRRQRKAIQAIIDLQNSLRVGDRVHTKSGLEGTITRIDDDNVDLEIAPGVITTWMKGAIFDKIESDDDTDAIDETDETGVEATEVSDSPKSDG